MTSTEITRFILDARDQTPYAGDAFQTQGGLVVGGDMRLPFPLPIWATRHKSTALKPARLAAGQGPVLESPQAGLTGAIARAAEKFEK